MTIPPGGVKCWSRIGTRDVHGKHLVAWMLRVRSELRKVVD